MKLNGKEVRKGFTLDSKEELPGCIADILGSFEPDEHLVDFSVKCGVDNESGKEVVRVICSTFIGEMKVPKPC